MFSSNQIFKVTGDRKEDLIDLLKYIEKLSNSSFQSYQITPNGTFALGWYSKKIEGWTPFQFEYSKEALADIIFNHLEKQECENDFEDYDGSTHKGYIAECEEVDYGKEVDGIINPFYCIVKFKPYMTFYSK